VPAGGAGVDAALREPGGIAGFSSFARAAWPIEGRGIERADDRFDGCRIDALFQRKHEAGGLVMFSLRSYNILVDF
jgi:hypothetical protein